MYYPDTVLTRRPPHDSTHRPTSDRIAPAVRPRSDRSFCCAGATRREVRRDVDIHELHIPVVQLPQPSGRAPGESGSLADVKGTRNTQQFLAGGASALVQDSMGKPWSGDYVNATGDLIGDLTHNFFLETGARNNKLKVYEMVEHPAARALTGYLLVRGGVHQVAYARALENLTGADLMKLFPSPRIPTDKIPECQPHIKRGEHLKLYRFSPSDFQEIQAVFNGPHPETGEDLFVAEEAHPEGAPPFDLPSQPAVFAPGPDPDMLADVSAKLRKAAGLPTKPTGTVANSNGKANGAAKKARKTVAAK